MPVPVPTANARTRTRPTANVRTRTRSHRERPYPYPFPPRTPVPVPVPAANARARSHRFVGTQVKRFEAENDDYSKIMVQALADRLVEAFAEALHADIRRTYWGFAADEKVR
jgi:Vitamin B12 dependent methionine synthase, activation domain